MRVSLLNANAAESFRGFAAAAAAGGGFHPTALAKLWAVAKPESDPQKILADLLKAKEEAWVRHEQEGSVGYGPQPIKMTLGNTLELSWVSTNETHVQLEVAGWGQSLSIEGEPARVGRRAKAVEAAIGRPLLWAGGNEPTLTAELPA